MPVNPLIDTRCSLVTTAGQRDRQEGTERDKGTGRRRQWAGRKWDRQAERVGQAGGEWDRQAERVGQTDRQAERGTGRQNGTEGQAGIEWDK